MINITKREPVVITGSEGLDPKGAKIFVVGILLATAALLLINFLPEANGYQMTLNYNLVP